MDRVQRRDFLIAAGALLAAPLPTGAKQAARVPRIGYLATSLPASPHLQEAFLQGLRELGYADGPNVDVPAIVDRLDDTVEWETQAPVPGVRGSKRAIDLRGAIRGLDAPQDARAARPCGSNRYAAP